ncbi:hypothetical protein V1512DRAFT_14178 [Lipomyces arxii]|uniref:uncharacterized protein n=1 Tax=Lipomyces arxii TaxID=56418 RepID=UPI0034CE9024
MGVLVKRQYYWYGSADWELKWAILGAILLGVFLILFVAYAHARYRLSKGLEPLRYHAWLVQGRLRHNQNHGPQQQDQPVDESTVYREYYTSYPAYAMTTFSTNQGDLPPPPPAYDPRYPTPPQYIPPSADPKPGYDAPPPGMPPPGLAGASSAYPTPHGAPHGAYPPVSVDNPYSTAVQAQTNGRVDLPDNERSAGTAYRYE